METPDAVDEPQDDAGAAYRAPGSAVPAPREPSAAEMHASAESRPVGALYGSPAAASGPSDSSMPDYGWGSVETPQPAAADSAPVELAPVDSAPAAAEAPPPIGDYAAPVAPAIYGQPVHDSEPSIPEPAAFSAPPSAPEPPFYGQQVPATAQTPPGYGAPAAPPAAASPWMAPGQQQAYGQQTPPGAPTYPPSTYPGAAAPYPPNAARPGGYPTSAYPAGAYPPAAYPPAAYPPAAYPPAAYPQNGYPQNANPQNAYPPGAYPPNAYASGAYPATAVPPASAPPGSAPPSAYPPGAYPPGAGYPPGSYPPGSYPPGAGYPPNQGAPASPYAPAYPGQQPPSGPYDPNQAYSYYYPPAQPPRRRRTGLIVTIVVSVVVLLCAGAVAVIKFLPDSTATKQNASSTTSTGASTKSTTPAKIDQTTLNGVLYLQSQALLKGDEKGFLAPVDPSATTAVSAYQRIYHNMRAMHVAIWEQSAPTGNYMTADRQTYEIDTTYCLVVKNCEDTDAEWNVTAVLKNGKAVIESFETPPPSEYTSEPYPWEVATLTAMVGPRVVVAASSAWSGTLSRALSIAERAATAADKYAHWGKPDVYVVYLASISEGKTWFDGGLANADGVTYTIQPHDLQVVILMPDAQETEYAGPGGLNAVIQHEFGHVATLQGDNADRGHDSFIEGIAEYCAYTGNTSWAKYRIEDVRAYLHTGKWKHTIYLTSEITSKSVLTGSAAYGIGYLGLRYLAETYGLDKMLTFWGDVERDSESVQTASTSAFGKAWTTVDAAAVSYVERQAD